MDKPNNATHAPRQCSNCACFARMLPDGKVVPDDGGNDGMLVCRRDTPASRLANVEVPVLKDGHAVIDRGRPRLERTQVVQIGYKPITPDAVCFDGWRPVGTLPGENYKLAKVERHLLPICAELARGNSLGARKLADGMLAAMLADST
jgi:hypothetical protein